MSALFYPQASPPSRPLASHRASARFFYLVDALGRLHEPTSTQLEALDRSYRSTGEFLAECPELDGLLHEIDPHGSRPLGAMVRPLDESREGFDIDLVARLRQTAMLKYGGQGGPAALLNDLFLPLQRYAKAHGLAIHRWERCVTLEYAGGMFADIAPIIDQPSILGSYGETLGRIPDRKLHLYDLTNPLGYIKHFDAAAAISPNFSGRIEFLDALTADSRAEVVPLPEPEEVFGRLLSRLVQLLKLHRNVAFGYGVARSNDVSPTSIFITTLAAAAYAQQAPLPHNSPLDLLLDIVDKMVSHFHREILQDGTERWILINPSAPNENLASAMNTPVRQAAFLQWHRKVSSDLSAILRAIENSAGMDVLIELLESAFGKRAARAVRDDELQRRHGNRAAGRVALIAAGAAPVVATARPHTFFGD